MKPSLKHAFVRLAGGPRDTAELLRKWEVEFVRNPNGSLYVPGDLNASWLIKLYTPEMRRNVLPDLSDVGVGGNFDCSGMNLTSLRGAPYFVGGDFWCVQNDLATLKGGPIDVGGKVWCCLNKLASLDGAPGSYRRIISDFGNFDLGDALPANPKASAANNGAAPCKTTV